MKKIITGLTLTGILLVPLMSMAAIPVTPTKNTDIETVINSIISWALGLLIVFAVLMLIVAGFIFVSAQGDMDKVKTARNFVLWALVGVLVGVLAYTLVQFVVTKIVP